MTSTTSSPLYGPLMPRWPIWLSLALSTAGVAVPFGIGGDPRVDSVSLVRLVLAGIAALALVGLAVEAITGRRHRWPYLAVGVAWATMVVYVAAPWQIDATPLWHVGHALLFAGPAALALTTWRVVACERRPRNG